ncbi:MAG TPA: TIGR03364 family FAD-dependent oxidoreductase [Streptosporangiaceae bacterium]|jgi:FAD dependent oxidoreductase TIGR03364
MAARTRVVIVGGGVLGTMHAVAARRRGFEVVQLEREPEARGASVRNFGLVWVSGRRPGPELSLALRARELWSELGAQVPGLGFRAAGSLTLATSDAELSLLKEAATLPDADRRGFEVLDAAAVRAVNPALRGDFAGGLHCRLDAIVEPRQVLPALRGYLATRGEGQRGYEWHPGREVTEIAPNAVRDHTGTWHQCDLVILCPGAAHTGIAGRYLARSGGVRRVRLQMMQTAPLDTRVTTALADGDSLRYYPAFDLPGRDRLPPQEGAAAQVRAQLLLVQRASGGLTIGDTHEYDEPFTFDLDEDAYDHLRGRAEALLGVPLPRIQRRWAGVYSEVEPALAGRALYHRAEVEPGVVLVTGPGGRGMTCSPAIAEETFS